VLRRRAQDAASAAGQNYFLSLRPRIVAINRFFGARTDLCSSPASICASCICFLQTWLARGGSGRVAGLVERAGRAQQATP
jgi:hypothetical protein